MGEGSKWRSATGRFGLRRAIWTAWHRGDLAVADLEFDLEVEMAPVPVTRFLPITDRQRQVVEPHHRLPPSFAPM
jgi:hypothetical protein